MIIFANQQVNTDSLREINQRKDDDSIFRIISKNGDERLVWNRMNLAEIEAAKLLFKELINKGMKAFRVGKKGEKTGEEIKEFDPSEGDIVFAPIPAVVGG